MKYVSNFIKCFDLLNLFNDSLKAGEKFKGIF